MGESDAVFATLTFLSVSASFPFLLYGAWYIIDAEPVTWSVLMHHLRVVVTGLLLTTVPMVTWMMPRLPDQIGGFAVLHAVLGLQAYAMLAFALTGIVRIFRAKRRHDLYSEYDEDVLLSEIGTEQFDHWRRRLRVGVFGYTFFWILAYLAGVARYVNRYVIG